MTSGYSVPCARKRHALERGGLLEEDLPELLADDVALELRVGDAGEQVEVAVLGVDVHEVDVELVAEDA